MYVEYPGPVTATCEIAPDALVKTDCGEVITWAECLRRLNEPESATDIVRRWADWIIWATEDMDKPEWGGKTEADVHRERDTVLAALVALERIRDEHGLNHTSAFCRDLARDALPSRASNVPKDRK